jgi:hypothetical protein
VTGAGFEPAPPKRPELGSGALDHSAILSTSRNAVGTKAPAVGIEPTTSGSGNRRASIAPRGLAKVGHGHAGARTQDLRLIRATLYRLSYTTLGVSGLVVEWLPATESARVRFPAHAFSKPSQTLSLEWELCNFHHRLCGPALPVGSSRTQAVKGVDQKSTGLCPRRFESCRLRSFAGAT